MTHSLVLNASYEPLSVVSARRAVCLLLAEKAELIEADSGVLRSERLTIQLPAVIRLCYMVKAPRRRVASVSRRAVFVRDEYSCQYCGDRADSIDHVLPRSRGDRRLGQPCGGVPRLQLDEAEPHTIGGRYATPSAVPGAPIDRLEHRGCHRDTRDVEAVSGPRRLRRVARLPT